MTSVSRVTHVLLSTAIIAVPLCRALFITVKHVELVDLTAPEEQETPQEPAVLTEEQHEDDLAQHMREGGELDVAEDDADLQLG